MAQMGVLVSLIKLKVRCQQGCIPPEGSEKEFFMVEFGCMWL